MIVHRDITVEDKKLIETSDQSLEWLLEDMESGKVHAEDLDPDLLERLRQLLLKQG